MPTSFEGQNHPQIFEASTHLDPFRFCFIMLYGWMAFNLWMELERKKGF